MMHGGGFRRIAETSDERAQSRVKVLARLFNELKPYRKSIWLAGVFILLASLAQATNPIIIGKAVDGFIAKGDVSGLLLLSGGLAIIFLVNMLAMRGYMLAMSSTGQRVLADLRVKVMAHIHSLSLQYLERREAGDLMSRVMNDVDVINSFISQGFAQLIGNFFSLTGIVIMMFVLEWRMAIAVIIIVPFMILITQFFAQVARQAFRKTRTTIGDVSAELQEELGGIKVAQAFQRTELNLRRFAERNAANRDANVSANAITSAFMPTMDLLSTVDLALVAAMGGYLALQHQISVGIVVTFIQYTQHFYRPIQMITQMWTIAQSALAAAERIYDLLDVEPDIKDAADAFEMPPIKGDIRFEGVNFGYKEDQKVLRDINLHIPAGSTIAIVGETGAGKTTIASLLLRFYEVGSGVDNHQSCGCIKIDGIDIRKVTQKSLRSQMAIVPQEPFLFSGSVYDNIRYGRLDATQAEIEEAAKAARAHEFIMRLPQGYQTNVGERGSLLSLGQRQLLSIARAILANPRILILDEATASVDTQTEMVIQQALTELLKGRTSVVIAHRLSTIRDADEVVVISQGRIVEQGSHDVLLSQKGVFAELYYRQFCEAA